MVGSDAVIGWGGSSPSVMPYHLEAKFVAHVVPNSVLTISAASVDLTNGVTTSYFTRPLLSGYNPINDAAKVGVVASTHDTVQGLIYHTCHVSRAFTLNLITGNVTVTGAAGNPKKDAHGALMLSGWGVFFVMGLLVAAVGRDIFKDGLWFKLHQFFQTVGLILTTTGFIISWFMVDGVFFNTQYHAQLGVAIMGAVYFQYLSGVFRPHIKPDQEKTPARKVFEILHPWTGRILCIAATVQIFQGINQPSGGRHHWWPFWVNIIYGVIVGTFILIGVVGTIIKLTKSKGDDTNYQQMG